MPSRRTDIDHRMGASDAVSIDTAVLMETAQAGKRTIGDIKKEVADLASVVAASSDYWASDAGNFYRDAFETVMRQFLAELDECGTYVHELVAYADEYEGKATEAVYLAHQIQIPTYDV